MRTKHYSRKARALHIAGVLCLMLLLQACPPCESITVDLGEIPPKVLNSIPYRNQEIYQFKHSEGLEISFTCQRNSLKEISSCEECCKKKYQYELNTTTLIPDYPIFNFEMSLSNLDTNYHEFGISIGSAVFFIPVNDQFDPKYYTLADSFLLDSHSYKNVFHLNSSNSNYLYNKSLYADSLYYNYEHGILQIKMSNGEKYTRIP